ncbi:MAG: hypothetical protein AABX66_00520 [Nanoarchaeota archaeon]
MNQRGDVAMTLLVLIALVSAIALLGTFVYYNQKKVNTPLEISEMMVEVENAQQYVISESHAIGMQAIEQGGEIRENFIKIAFERDYSVKSFGNFFYKIRNNEFNLEYKEDGSYLLQINDVFVQSTKGMNSVKREFNISVVLKLHDSEWKDISLFE